MGVDPGGPAEANSASDVDPCGSGIAVGLLFGRHMPPAGAPALGGTVMERPIAGQPDVGLPRAAGRDAGAGLRAQEAEHAQGQLARKNGTPSVVLLNPGSAKSARVENSGRLQMEPAGRVNRGRKARSPVTARRTERPPTGTRDYQDLRAYTLNR